MSKDGLKAFVPGCWCGWAILPPAAQSIAKLTASEKDHPDPAVQFIPHLAGVELAWLTHDLKLADHHSIRIDEIAASSRIPYLAVYASVCKALVLSLSGNHVAAIQKLESAIRLATEAYAGMEYQSEMLASLAEIHLRSNSPTAAFRVAERGIAVARERHARLAECRSTIILALVLSEGQVEPPELPGKRTARACASSHRGDRRAALREPARRGTADRGFLRMSSVNSRSP
jgi:adenylate cyclase